MGLTDKIIIKQENINPNKILPTSPINTLAFGMLKNKKPIHEKTMAMQNSP
jgi:hypothetical protein